MKYSLVLTYLPCLLAACTETKVEECTEVRNRPKALSKSDKSYRCYLALNGGLCKAGFSAYYFNWNTRECEKSSHGGCRGCKPFKDRSECESSCKMLMNHCKTQTQPSAQRKTNDY
ncbi:hypothetical protein DSO57_1019462 [Entomophthora muscae]|uniref:Uncharacterized protein n=1 Tax=Entomophthora muscae TaxID=34485 RepID=A0ACC2TRK2_9FUNG|nr:hypothetical protein DSO57_1019462 [Entomophthora muscae]